MILKKVSVVPRMNAKSDGSINAAFTRIHEAQRPDDCTRVLTARGKAVPHGAGDWLVCHQPNTQCTRRIVKKVGQSINFGSLYLGHFLPDSDNSPLILFLLSCRRRNKSEICVFSSYKITWSLYFWVENRDAKHVDQWVNIYKSLIESTDLWPQQMFTFLEMLAMIVSERSFGAFVCRRRPAGLHRS